MSMIIYDINDDIIFTVIFGAISAFVVFSLTQAIFFKDIKKMFNNKIQAVVLIAVISIFNILLASDVLKLDDKIIATANTERVTINIIVNDYYSNITFKDKDNIKAVVDFIEKHKTESYKNVDFISLNTPEYDRLNVSRHFEVPKKDIKNFIKENYDKDEFKKSIYNIEFDNRKVISLWDTTKSRSFDLSKNEPKELMTVLQKEAMQYDYETVSNSKVVYTVEGLRIFEDSIDYRWATIPVYDCFEETVALINKYITDALPTATPEEAVK